MPLQFEKIQYVYCLYHVYRMDFRAAAVWPKIIILFFILQVVGMKNVKKKPQGL